MIRVFTAFALVLSLAAFASAQHDDHKDKHDQGEKGGMQMEPKLPPPNPNQGYFGAKFGPISDEAAEELGLDSQDGVVIMEVMADSPAAKAGIKPKDVVKKLNDKDITDVPSFVTIMRASKPDDQLKVSLIRDKKAEEVTVTLGKRPASMNEQQQKPKMEKDNDNDKEPATKPSDK
jgi:S1-C subfamily serine protease